MAIRRRCKRRWDALADPEKGSTLRPDRRTAARLSTNPRAYQALAGLLNAEMQGKNFGAARALIEKQLAQNPNDPRLN